MKRLRLAIAASLLVLAPVAKAAQPIVGLWDNHYYHVGVAEPFFHTHEQWHSDGTEFEVNSLGPGAVCQGVWKSTAERGIKLKHVGFAFMPNVVGPVAFDEIQELTVSVDGKSYDGTFRTVYHTPGGDVVDEGTTHADRISVD